MIRITFYGAAEEVTGSCFLVEGGGLNILVDCGLFQGNRFASKRNEEPLPFPCGKIDYVLVTHAHIDHTGRIPEICWSGFTGKIFATKPTLALTKYLWKDALEIMEIDYQESGRLPLYSGGQMASALKFFQGASYGEKIKLSNRAYAVFHDAGHILGSAFIELVVDGKKIVFSGDLGNRKPPIIKESEDLPADTDLLVCESTYGDRDHESQQEREKALFSMVDETLRRGGVLMIPAFAVERTQEILYLLNSLIENKKLPRVNVYLDSPLAIEATKVFQKYPYFYNRSDYLLRKSGDDLFDFPGLVISKTRRQSQMINEAPGPKIIIAGSGMMNGGRITYHLERYLPDPKSTLFIVGFQAKGTLGRKILGGQKTVLIHGRKTPVRAHVHAIGSYSAHADQKKLLSWIGAAKNLESVALVHGEPETMTEFARAIKHKNGLNPIIPKLGETITI